MANWCRNIVRVLGPAPEVDRFVSYIEQEDEEKEGSLTYIADWCLESRDACRAEYEVLSKWRPPLAILSEASRHFSELTLQVEWEQPADGLLGCAVLSNGNMQVLELDTLLEFTKEVLRAAYQRYVQDEWEAGHAEVVISLEMLRESSRLFFGNQRDEQDEEVDTDEDALREYARQVVRAVFNERKLKAELSRNWNEEGF